MVDLRALITDIELTDRELHWLRSWFRHKGVVGVPSEADIVDALWALHAFNEAMTLQAPARVQ